MECGLLLSEMVFRLARVDECVAGAVCFRFAFGSLAQQRACRRRHRLTAGAVSHHELSSTISANRCTLFSGKPHRFCTTDVSSRILSTSQPSRVLINSVVSASRRHPGDLVTLKLTEVCRFMGHLHLMIETLILMDLHRGGSSPPAHLPLGQGTGSEQTPSSCTVWVVVGVPTQLARIHSIKPRAWGTFAVSVLAGCWCLVCRLTTRITTTLPMF